MIEETPPEQWRTVCDGYYEVSDFGRVRRAMTGTGARVGYVLKPWLTTRGYLQVRLCIAGKDWCPTVHKLVALAFIGPRPPQKQVNHQDGNKQNNRLTNLEYVTKAENEAHALRTGLKDTSGLLKGFDSRYHKKAN